MERKLEVAIVQSDLVWENPEQNRINFKTKMDELTVGVDLIVFPEMFTTGFTMYPKTVAETMQGETVMWMKDMASIHKAAIVGSLIIVENKRYYNRLLFVEPSGEINIYNKRHAFTLVGENKVYTAGSEKIIINYKGWKICPLICYDLRFPVWARNTENYDILLYVANWPKPRISAWNTLLKARAIENMSYCIGVNRVGVDGVNSIYNGCSAVYNVLGECITSTQFNTEQVALVSLDKKHITAYRNKFKFLNDSDEFVIR